MWEGGGDNPKMPIFCITKGWSIKNVVKFFGCPFYQGVMKNTGICAAGDLMIGGKKKGTYCFLNSY